MTVKVFKNLIIVRTESRLGLRIGDHDYNEINEFKDFLRIHGITYTEGRSDRYRNDEGIFLDSQAFILDDTSMTAYRIVRD